jgi:branched-subunit amino acid transport protein
MTKDLFLYIGVMALVTYLIRMLPLAVFRKKIRSRFILSFLHLRSLRRARRP